MRKLLYFALFLAIVIIPACSSNLKAENEQLKSELVAKNAEIDNIKYGAEKLYKEAENSFNEKDYEKAKEAALLLLQKHPTSKEAEIGKELLEKIENALKKEQESKELAAKQEYIKQSESYRPKIQEMYNKISKHYSDLNAEYNKQKASYNINTWTVFLNNWNNQLKIYRADLDTYKANGHTYNLFYAKNQIASAATTMAAIWMYYSDLLKSPNDKKAQENLLDFDKDVKEFLSEAKKYLELGN